MMEAIGNEYLTDINPAILKEQVQACRRLWKMVIIYALREARDRIANTKSKYIEQAIRKEMRYFESPDFKKLCELADVEIKSVAIKQGLRTLRKWDARTPATKAKR